MEAHITIEGLIISDVEIDKVETGTTGVYVITDGLHNYVGQSNDISNRLKSHYSSIRSSGSCKGGSDGRMNIEDIRVAVLSAPTKLSSYEAKQWRVSVEKLLHCTSKLPLLSSVRGSEFGAIITKPNGDTVHSFIPSVYLKENTVNAQVSNIINTGYTIEKYPKSSKDGWTGRIATIEDIVELYIN